MNIILNTTKSSRNRYRLISGHMGNYNKPSNSPNHRYVVVNGIDRGNGYQGYMSVTYALNECDYLPQEVKDNIKLALKGD